MRSTKIKKTFAVLVYGLSTAYMVILISQNKITDFFMILAWACPFNMNQSNSSYVDTAIAESYIVQTGCRHISPTLFQPNCNTLVIRRLTKHCSAKRSLIDWRICVNIS